METYNLKNDLKVFGIQVKTFPAGIGEAFEALLKMLPGGFDRDFYGISRMAGNNMVYYATAVERYDGEAEKYNCERYTIEKGKYLSVTVTGWRKKTDCIKDVFQMIIKDNRVDKTSPAIEWYKNDEEMLCMVKTIAR